jgi:hypothetical protein
VKVSTVTVDGKEVVLAFRGPGARSFVSLTLVFRHIPFHAIRHAGSV